MKFLCWYSELCAIPCAGIRNYVQYHVLTALPYLLSFLIVNLIVIVSVIEIFGLELCAISCAIVSLKNLPVYIIILLFWCSGTIEIYPTLRYRTETVTPAAVNGLGKRIFWFWTTIPTMVPYNQSIPKHSVRYGTWYCVRAFRLF